MRAVHEDALICDFAQYYHVYEIDSLDVRTAAVLACGLPADSRAFRESSRSKETGINPDSLFKAAVIDAIRNVEWAICQTHSKKRLKRPESVTKKLLGQKDEQHQNVQGFETPEEYEAARQRIIEGA